MDGFRHTYALEVRFRDLDALGHVNNAVYFTYLETARVDYIRRVIYDDPQRGVEQMGLILAEIGCTFRRPIFLGQRVLVGTRVVALGRSSYTIENQIAADGELVATGRAVAVHYDYAAGRSAPIPDAIRERIMQFEGL